MDSLTDQNLRSNVSAIVPTIGRPESLRQLLESLSDQTVAVLEVIVADGSGNGETEMVTSDSLWKSRGLRVVRLPVQPPNAVRQRQAAIREAQGELLLLLDDDVVLEGDCLEQMLATLGNGPDVVAVTADFNNQSWSQPTRAWKFYLRHFVGLAEGAWQGKVVGPLLRFGYNPAPTNPRPMEWLGAGNSLVRRSAYERAGGFSDFFLHRCTTNEDVDLGRKLSRMGRILFCPAARMAHHHTPGGRVSASVAAEDDLYNRYFVLRRTCGKSVMNSFCLVVLFLVVETSSHFLGCLKRCNFTGFMPRCLGRLRAVLWIALRRGAEALPG